MMIGYTRVGKSLPSIKAQRNALGAGGFDLSDPYVPIYSDDERQAAIMALQPGDMLVVASAACLGGSVRDVCDAAVAIGRRGGSILDLETGDTITPSAQEIMVVDFAVRAENAIREATGKLMRKARAASGNLGGITAVEWDKSKLDRLRVMIEDGETRSAMADELGVSQATLYRKLRELRDNSK